jgi:hypothetical protein
MGGCTTHQCDPDCIVKGAPISPTYCAQGGSDDGGFILFGQAFRDGNEIIWESAAINEPWLDYTGQRTYWLNWRAALHDDLGVDVSELTVIDIVAYVSTDEQNPTSNFVPASGQLAEINYLNNEEVHISNATCAEYFLRVVMHGQLTPTDGAKSDAASADAADSGSEAAPAPDAADAGVEATADASADRAD